MLLPTANACNVQGVSKERKNLLLLYKREEDPSLRSLRYLSE